MFELCGKFTDAIVYADNCESIAISQIMELCNHPVFEEAKICIMPDVHAGSGCTIGTTIHLKAKKVIPNIVGVDIGCGILATIFETEKEIDFKSLDNFISENIPNGHGVRTNKHPQIKKEIEQMISEIVSDLKLEKLEYHINSCGSLGGGNHFVEINKINNNTYILFVHSGSRNLGKKVCEYFQKKAIKNCSEKKELKNDFSSNYSGFSQELSFLEGNDYENYVKNMIKCQSIAKENRNLITNDILNYLSAKKIEDFDTIHNYIEQIEDGSIIIRKGAISAKKGEKLSIPLNMKDGVIIGIGKGNKEWNISAPHGAGRLLSRSEANNSLSLEEFKEQMKEINTWSVCDRTLDESPMAYKPSKEIIEQIQDTVEINCIAQPIYNFKAHIIQKHWHEIKKT